MQIIRNAVIGVESSPNTPFSTNRMSGEQRVLNYAGIRADSLPVRMIGNVVAGSNDMGFMVETEPCPASRIFNNKAFATIMGAFILPQKSGSCQTVSLYKVWKAAHTALYLADVIVSKTQINHVTLADSHIAILPYYTVGSSYRRLWVNYAILIGSSQCRDAIARSHAARSRPATDASDG